MKWASVGLAIAGVGASLALASPASAQVQLDTAGNFAALAGAFVSNTGPTVVNGGLGVSPGTSITGFPPGIVIGGFIHAGDATAAQAQMDLTTAYNTAVGLPCAGAPNVPANVGGLTLTPGVYCFALNGGITGTLTLDFQGNPNAEFVFQVPGALNTASASQVALTNIGAVTCPPHVTWQVGASATLGTNSAFKGNILAFTSASLTTGTTLDGRALAMNGLVTMDTNTITSCAAIPVADVSVDATSTPGSVMPGGDVAYDIAATNQGPDAATTAEVTATIPSGLTFKSLVAPAGWVCTTPAVGASGTVSCTNASFAVGSANFALTTTLDAAATSVPAVQLGVTSSTPDSDGSNDSFTADDTQVAVPTPTPTPTPTPPPTPVPPAPTATPTPTPPAPPKPAACVSHRTFTVQLKTLSRALRTGRVVSAKLLSDKGKTLRNLKITRTQVTVDLNGLSKQRVTVRATVRSRAGQSIRVTRDYGTCDLPNKG